MTKPFDLIVFDWDGTLMDSTYHIVRTIQTACESLGLPIPSDEAAQHVIGLSLYTALKEACPNQAEAVYPELVDAYRRFYVTRPSPIQLFKGVKEGLAALKESSVMLAVATGKSRIGLNHALQETDTSDFFISTKTVDECHSKPHPDMLDTLMAELGVSPDRTVMIGDTTHDLAMAQNAKTQKIGVSYGAHPKEMLNPYQPLAIFDQASDLFAWLKQSV